MKSPHSGRLAQLVRAPALQAGGPRFEPATAHHFHVGQIGNLPPIENRPVASDAKEPIFNWRHLANLPCKKTCYLEDVFDSPAIKVIRTLCPLFDPGPHSLICKFRRK